MHYDNQHLNAARQIVELTGTKNRLDDITAAMEAQRRAEQQSQAPSPEKPQRPQPAPRVGAQRRPDPNTGPYQAPGRTPYGAGPRGIS